MHDGTRLPDIGIDAVLRSPSRNGADMLADHVRSPGLRLSGAIPAFELKFVLDAIHAERVTRWCAARMQPDPHGDPALGGLYRTTTLYLDTAAFDVLHGVGAFRWHKYRLRRYGHEPWVFAERKRKADEFGAKQNTIDPQVRSDRIYHFLARTGRQLIEAGEKQAEVEQNLLNTWTPTDLKVAVAIASGRLTKQAWDEMGFAGREKLFRPRGFRAWEDQE